MSPLKRSKILAGKRRLHSINRLTNEMFELLAIEMPCIFLIGAVTIHVLLYLVPVIFQ
jgi:hypothetical protein